MDKFFRVVSCAHHLQRIEHGVRQILKDRRETAVLKGTMENEVGTLRMQHEVSALRNELRDGVREVVAAVTAPRELIRDHEGRPQRAVSLYEGEIPRPANEQSRPI